MSANTWGYYRDVDTGKVAYLPCDAASVLPNLVPTEDDGDCVDCASDYGTTEVYEDVTDLYDIGNEED